MIVQSPIIVDARLVRFALITQISICSVATLALFSIWRRGSSPDLPKKARLRDRGILFMWIACLLWCVMGVLEMWGTKYLMATRTVFSLANSMLFIGAAGYLDIYRRQPPWLLVPLIDREKQFWVSAVSMLVCLLALLAMFDLGPGEPKRYYIVLDVVISIAALFLLMHGYFTSFKKRKFPVLAYLSVGVLGFQVVAQLPELTRVGNETLRRIFLEWPLLQMIKNFDSDNSYELRVASKGMICLLFVALTFSWVHQKSETLAGGPTEIFLNLFSIDEVSKPVGWVRSLRRLELDGLPRQDLATES